MSTSVYKKIELTGTSSVSIEDAVQTAIQKAAESVRGMSWFEVLETRGRIEGSQVTQWQVTVKVGFAVD